jgi:hypothetical protein
MERYRMTNRRDGGGGWQSREPDAAKKSPPGAPKPIENVVGWILYHPSWTTVRPISSDIRSPLDTGRAAQVLFRRGDGLREEMLSMVFYREGAFLEYFGCERVIAAIIFRRNRCCGDGCEVDEVGFFESA